MITKEICFDLLTSSPNYSRKCLEISQKNLYVDIAAKGIKAVIHSEATIRATGLASLFCCL